MAGGQHSLSFRYYYRRAYLTWPAAQDDTAVTGYVIYNGSNIIKTVDGNVLSYNVTGLSAGSRYTFTVKAKDAAGNVSGRKVLKRKSQLNLQAPGTTITAAPARQPPYRLHSQIQ